MCDTKTSTSKNKVQESRYKTRIKDNILFGVDDPLPTEPISVAEVVLKTLRSNPDCIGQIDALTDKRDTYAEMSERSIKCALWLKKQGIKAADIIGLCTDNNLDAIPILLGITSLNAICSTWDYELTLMSARYFLSMTSPKIVFTIPLSAAILTEAAKELKMNVKIVVIGKLDGYESTDDIFRDFGDRNSREIAEFKCTPISSVKEICLIVPTSGTTGMPKVIEISHFILLSNLRMPSINVKMNGHICMTTSSMRWMYCIWFTFKTILACATRVILPQITLSLDPETDNDETNIYCQYIEKYQASWLAFRPFVLMKMIKMDLFEKYRLSSIKFIITTGSTFPKQYQEAFKKKLPHALVCNAYGTTDTGGGMTSQDEYCKLGSIGYPYSNVQIKIADTETDKALGVNKIGEIRTKAPFGTNGYYKNPEATKKAFDSDGWFCTGDLGYYDDDGELFITGRISEFILYRTIHVLPAEIERVLENHPAVFQAAVIGMPDEIDEQRPMAIVSVVPGTTVTEQELISLVEKNLPDHCRLRAGVKFMNKLPETATGKIAKKQLREMFAT